MDPNRSSLAGRSRVLSTDSEKTLVESPNLLPPSRHSRPRNIRQNGAGATENSHQKSQKNSLYKKKRGPLCLRRAINNNVTEAFGGPSIVCANASSSRTREPTYAANLRTMIRDVVERKLQEEDEERRLRELLGERVIGGADKFGCVKVRRNFKTRRG
ncbi:hypothetical protein B0H12DRAFT_1107915 [Mycena haematopus]|nr:hypothetical protein B0H12DRAFT_1107915 [Mycena haematopus]